MRSRTGYRRKSRWSARWHRTRRRSLAVTPATIPELLSARVRATPNAEAYRQYDSERAVWVSYSWGEIEKRTGRWRGALTGEGFASGARIALLIPNGIEHVCIDQAALSLGFVPVPMHVIDQPESLVYMLADSGASLLLVDSANRWRTLEPFASSLPSLKRVVYLAESVPPSPAGIACALAQWLDATQPSARRSEIARSVDPDALAAIVYTSGTTGRPKGVMLSHRNVVSNVHAIMAAVPVSEHDVFLSFLPLSHTFERTAGYYLPMAAGATVAFARSVAMLMSDLLTVRPTVLISVPRIYERAYARLRATLDRHALSRALFALTVEIGWRRFQQQSDDESPSAELIRAIWPALDRLIAARVRARFGGRVRVAVSGGAPIPQVISRTFLALGMPLLQGYGLTETAPVVACNTLADNRPDSVGRPLPGIEVRLGEHEELLVRGPNVMRGYWQRPEETARVLEPDGWLHTGDQARIDDGHIIIKGRIKDILVTSTGEKIAPADLESAILADPLFEQVMVLGEGRPYIAALVVLNRERWGRHAEKYSLSAEDPATLRAPAVLGWVLNHIARAVRGLPAYAVPRTARVLLEPWTIDAGLMTPTLKPKRLAIEKQFAAEIAELYRGHESRGRAATVRRPGANVADQHF
jgi:long-chain acyl-CoA synthetase